MKASREAGFVLPLDALGSWLLLARVQLEMIFTTISFNLEAFAGLGAYLQHMKKTFARRGREAYPKAVSTRT